MELWTLWWEAIYRLRSAFSCKAIFFWFTLIVAGLCVRRDLLGLINTMEGELGT